MDILEIFSHIRPYIVSKKVSKYHPESSTRVFCLWFERAL